MSTFITLPSGLRVNTAHILEYREVSPRKTVIIQNTVLKDINGFDAVEQVHEDMTAAELDALLSPTSSPIVEAVVNLDKVRLGSACQFTYKGKVKHGLISAFCGGENQAEIFILHDGDSYMASLDLGTVELE